MLSISSVPVKTSRKETRPTLSKRRLGANGRLPVVGRVAHGQSPANLGERQPKRGEPQFKVSQGPVLGLPSTGSIPMRRLRSRYLSLPYLSALVPGKLICCRCLAGLLDALAAVLSNGCPVKEMSGLLGSAASFLFFFSHEPQLGK